MKGESSGGGMGDFPFGGGGGGNSLFSQLFGGDMFGECKLAILLS